MANNHSITHVGFTQLQRSSQLKSHETKGNVLSAPGSGWGGEWNEGLHSDTLVAEMDSMKEDDRGHEIMSSHGSSDGTGSWIISDGQHLSPSETPTEHLPDAEKMRYKDSRSFEGLSYTPLIRGEEESKPIQFIASDRESAQNQSADTNRPPSPRALLQNYKSEKPNSKPVQNVAPLDSLFQSETELASLQTEEQVAEAWKKLRTLRAKALRLRLQVRNKRETLQEQERDKVAADEAFMKYSREHRPSLFIVSKGKPPPPLDPRLDALFEALVVTRDAYGPLEEEYNSLEDELDETEFQLARMESLLYNAKMPPFVQFPSMEADPPSEDEDLKGPESDPFLGLPSDNELAILHPLQATLLSRLGDLDLVHESYHDLLQEKHKVLWNKENRARVGLELNGEDSEFLAEFPNREASLRREIITLEEDVKQDRAKCVAAGLDISTDIEQPATLIPQDQEKRVAGSISWDKHPAESSHSMFPLLLPKSDQGKANLEVLISKFDESEKDNRSSRWILHRLRTTPLEANLIMRTFLHTFRLKELQQWKGGFGDWQFCVLMFWDKDSHAKDMSHKTEKTFTRKAEHTTLCYPDGNYFTPRVPSTLLKRAKSTAELPQITGMKIYPLEANQAGDAISIPETPNVRSLITIFKTQSALDLHLLPRHRTL